MKKILTAVLIGPALNWAVAKCEEGILALYYDDDGNPVYLDEAPDGHRQWEPSTSLVQGVPIIEREKISIIQQGAAGLIDTELDDVIAISKSNKWAYGPTLLIAGMRCHVASILGDEIEVPDELVCDMPFNQIPIKTDVEFTNSPGELGGLWGQIGDAENVLAEKLKDLPKGTAVTLDEDVWFLIVEDGYRILCIGQLQNGVVQNVHCRFDFGLDYVDVAADDLREAIERVKRATETFNTVVITSYQREE